LTLDRRAFLGALGAGVAGVVAGCRTSLRDGLRPPVAFNTANLAGRCTGYRFELSNWADQHARTVARTDLAEWAAICEEIARTGFHAVEIWEAHASPEALTQARAREWRRVLDSFGLLPVGYAGGLRAETLEICRWLGIPQISGGLRGLSPAEATRLCRAHGVQFNYENHPEKSVAEILSVIGGGNEWLGVCVDTGWLGTQGANAAEVIRALGARVRHTHIKDVTAAGAHQTCLLGEGVVDVPAALEALRETGYTGWYSWEDEPEDRNPFHSAVRNREWLEARLRRR
jgi:sugar phosphate isomerase/epimerase